MLYPATDDAQARLNALHRYAIVGKCVNGVTHDLNNYLGAILAYSELLGLDESLNPDARRMAARITESVMRCTDLVRELTNIARKEKATTATVAPAILFSRVLLLRHYALNVDGIQVESRVEPGLPDLLVDVPKLTHVLIELLSNAQDALQGCAPKQVRLCARRTSGGLSLSVWDSGPGVPEAERPRIFEPFYTTKPTLHVGLGLPRARAVVGAHGGDLSYAPDDGFVVLLPESAFAPQVL